MNRDNIGQTVLLVMKRNHTQTSCIQKRAASLVNSKPRVDYGFRHQSFRYSLMPSQNFFFFLTLKLFFLLLTSFSVIVLPPGSKDDSKLIKTEMGLTSILSQKRRYHSPEYQSFQKVSNWLYLNHNPSLN